MENIRVLISGGGTGGHIFPAISIANAVKNRFPQAEILFIGAEGRMEMTKVPAAGYRIEGLDIQGLDRKRLHRNIAVLWKYFKSLRKAKTLIKNFRPDIAVGVGGYASAPTLRKAASMRIPTLIQEQNSYAGVTNKHLAEKASKICVAYEGMERFFPSSKIVLTGNPVRQDLVSEGITKEEAYQYFGLRSDKKTILVVGGSLGSRTINSSIANHLDELQSEDIQILWQCGGYYINQMTEELAKSEYKDKVRLYDFINRMDYAYKIADLVISRAGAGAISELCLLGKPTILVPSPNVAEDHQTKNARALEKRNAVVVINDKEAEPILLPTAVNLVENEDRLKEMSDNISQLAQKNSSDRIVDEIIKIVEANKK